MYKAKINKSITSLIVIIALSLPIYHQTIDAFSFSFDTILQKAYQLTQWKKITDINKDISQWDIFLSTYQTISAPNTSAIINAITNIKNDLIKKNTCTSSPTDSDIITILSKNKDFKRQIYEASDISLSNDFTTTENIEMSCQKVLYCLWTNTSQKIDSRKELQDCYNIIYNRYQTRMSMWSNYLSQPIVNNTDNIFLDGNKDNAPFDLMEDIEDIKNILFNDKNGPKIPEMIYYSMPSVNIPWNTTANPIPWTINGFWWTTLVWWSTASLDDTTQDNNNVIDNPWWNWDSNQWALSEQSGLWQIKDPIQTFIDTNKNNSIITTDSNITLSNWSLIQAPLCPASGQIDNISIPVNSVTTDLSGLDSFEDIQQQFIDILSGILYYPSGVWELSNLGDLLPSNGQGWWNNYNQNSIQTANPSLESQQCSNSCQDTTDQVEKQICEGKCCIQACKNITNTSQKAECVSQCLCGELKTKNDELRIKFCRVPAQPSRVIANEYLETIEEGVDALNGIFLYLKNNGQMTKRAKTKEMLDSSLRDIKLHKIIAFDIFIAIKPIYDKISLSVKKEEKEKENISVKQAIHLAWVKLWDKIDRSRYIVKWDHSRVLALKEVSTSYADFNNNVRLKEAIQCQERWWIYYNDTCNFTAIDQNNIINNNFITINDEIYKFIDKNYNLREQISKIFSDILYTTTVLKTKGENAK